jgi:hypothetical protein
MDKISLAKGRTYDRRHLLNREYAAPGDLLACASVLVLAGLLVAYYEGEITRYLIALRRK